MKRERERERVSERIYGPGTTAFNQGEVGPEGGWVVVSWVPLRLTSVDLAASHPESSRVFPILAIAFRTESWLAQKSERERERSQCVVIFLSLCIVGAWVWERRVREGYFWYFESFGWGRVLIAPRGLSAFVSWRGSPPRPDMKKCGNQYKKIMEFCCKLSCNNFYKNTRINALDRHLSKLIFKWKIIYQDWIFY